MGLIMRNASSSWVCAPSLVHKPRPEKWMFTTGFGPVNRLSASHSWQIQHLDSVIVRLVVQKCFASNNICQGYWQLPLDETSQDCQSFIAPNAVYSTTRDMDGKLNAVEFFQSSVQIIYEYVSDNIIFGWTTFFSSFLVRPIYWKC